MKLPSKNNIKNYKRHTKSKSICKLLLIVLIFSLLSKNTFATIVRGSEPAPPKACRVSGVLYTNYVRTVYSPSNSSTNITGYRYIFSGSGSKVTCVNSSTIFMGTDPNNPSSNTAIGCDIDKTQYSQTSHNDSIANFVACPIDDYIPLMVLGFGFFGFIFINRHRLA